MSRKQAKAKARLRAQLIMKVRCGLMTASEAAKQMGVSRKTYYKWEQRGLSAMLDGLSDHTAGRPANRGDPSETVFEKQMAAMKRENELLEQKLVLKDLVADFNLRHKNDRKEKK